MSSSFHPYPRANSQHFSGIDYLLFIPIPCICLLVLQPTLGPFNCISLMSSPLSDELSFPFWPWDPATCQEIGSRWPGDIKLQFIKMWLGSVLIAVLHLQHQAQLLIFHPMGRMWSCPSYFMLWLWILITLFKLDQKRWGRKEDCSDIGWL